MSEIQNSQETIRSTLGTARADVLTRFQEKSRHPRWLGEVPRLPYPPGTMFGYMRLLSDELVRVSSLRLSGKNKGKKRYELFARFVCTKCGNEVLVQKSSLNRRPLSMCKECSFRQTRYNELISSWGKIPDEFDLYLRRKWQSIKTRCEDPCSRHWKRYGGRGIKLSDEFQDTRVFVEYVRSLPNASRKLQLDRIDNNRGYERGNLRWVTGKDNCNNRECSITVKYGGETIPLPDFVDKHTNMSYNYVKKLLQEGKSAEDIVSWRKNTKNVTYNGASMSLRQFALNHTGMTPTSVRRLYLRGLSLDEIVAWDKHEPKKVSFGGCSMTFPEFVKKHTELSVPYATKLFRDGVSLDDLSTWRKKSDVVTYNGNEMHFKDFVRDYAKMSYVYARQMYRQGKSLDEIAGWERRSR